ncbi:hypothetical protein [Pantoea sp. AS142]|uniref:hypothetical protein n=1 Tax=Pantoea sp. AS142 TaxID=3081292 RepID=UPI003FA7209E
MGRLDCDRMFVTVLETFDTPPLGLLAVYSPARHWAHRARLLIDFLVTHFTRFPPL